MDIFAYLERKRLWCEENREDQRQLGKIERANYWHGRALSFQEIQSALDGGVVTPDGIVKLDISSIK